MKSITYEDVCQLVDYQGEFNQHTFDVIDQADMTYDVLSGNDRERLMCSILREIDSNTLAKTGNKSRWERGWGENLVQYKDTGKFESLRPMYITKNKVCRVNGEYIVPLSNELEPTLYIAIEHLLYGEFLSEVTRVFEFGCGTGICLKHISDVFPQMELHGLDWANASVDILESMRETEKMNVHGHLFDMLQPNESFTVPPGSAILTVGALEQLGTRFEPFLQYMLRSKPKVVIHLEPIVEMYQQDSLFDYVAYKHDIMRDYLQGYLPRLMQLQKDGKIRILKINRTRVGNKYHEGHNIIIWTTA